MGAAAAYNFQYVFFGIRKIMYIYTTTKRRYSYDLMAVERISHDFYTRA